MELEVTNDHAFANAGTGGRLDSVQPASGLPAFWVQAAGLIALCLTLNLVGNGRMSLWDRDEPRYAGCAREMRTSGDFVHPMFNAEPRYHKPILTYWLMQVGVLLAGDNPFGNRLISALAGMGTCLIVWSLGRRMLGERAGLIAAGVLATSLMMVAESKLATTDSILFFFMALAWLALWQLKQADSARWAFIFWVSFAMAVLTKGPVAPLFLAAAAGVERFWTGPSPAWRRLRWRWGVPLFVVLAAPWYVAIGIISKGQFYEVAMGRHVIHRMTTDMETHGGFPGFYVAGTLIGLFPWSAFLPAALWHAWKQRRTARGIGFAVGWWLGPLIVLEIIRTKLIHYFLPATAGAALLVAWFLEEVALSESNLRRWSLGRLSLAIATGGGLVVAVAALASASIAPAGLRWPLVVLGCVIGMGTIAATEPLLRAATRRGVYALAATSALSMAILGGWLLPACEPYRLTPLVATGLKRLCAEEHAKPILASYQPPGVVYNFGEPIAVRQDQAWLHDFVAQHGAVAAALTPAETRGLMKDRALQVNVKGTVSGLNIERGRDETLNLVVLRTREPSENRVGVAPNEAQRR